MSGPKTLKKSESLEIRIPYPTKTAFMARCRDEGRSASDTLRAFIDQHLDSDARAASRSRRRRRLAVGAMIAAALGAVALPSLARPSAHVEFERLDVNSDGAISRGEYQQAR